jgi:methionyl-tRNA synthetase
MKICEKCKQMFDSANFYERRIELCPLHAAADEMLKALNDVSRYLSEDNPWVRDEVDAAIKSATGER